MAKRLEEAKEINLVPIMNLVTILIPFLLVGAAFVGLAVIDSALPGLPDEPPPGSEGPDLSVLLTDQGHTVTLPNKAFEVPCSTSGCPTPAAWDFVGLTRVLAGVKDQHPDLDTVILVPEERITYEVLVRTMDATREDPAVREDGRPRSLFPSVVIAGGLDG